MVNMTGRNNGGTITSSSRLEFDVENEVIERYGAGAEVTEPGLCCPTEYDTNYLKLIPEEILQKDYGCGDPSQYVKEGEVVVDLGSGAGKICYILAQKVGAPGQVIGVDFNDRMLSLAREYLDEMADKLGYRNVKFVKGKIQDLALDLELAEDWLEKHPVKTMQDLSAFETECDRLRKERPLIATESVDVVVSNCVLNLVRPSDKQKLFEEIYRVLRRGGRAVISDIVSDEEPTPSIVNNPKLWSDCIAGAFREDGFLKMFEDAGFYGIEIIKRQQEPWKVIEGIEFRSMTVCAFKGKEGPCLERKQAVVYRGPWRQVKDDDGHVFYRGKRMAVCDKTFQIMTDPDGPYAEEIIGIEPLESVPLEAAEEFPCNGMRVRHPRETKGEDYEETRLESGDDCGCGTDCC